jgi:putative SOS response-associated peptidase YedK
MCGRYSLATPDPASVRARFGIEESVEIRRRYNVAPGDEVLAVTTSRDGEARGELLKWGLVPSWAKTPETGLKMINARVETASQRPAFRGPFERSRCLVVADGFYEWQRQAAGSKQPFHIARTDGQPFAFAGLWSIWHDQDGRQLRSCAILTTAANWTVAPLHDRMPIILHPEHERVWLHTTPTPAELDRILRGLPASEIALRPVSRAVNDARYDGPECLEPAVNAEQPALF